MRKQIFAIVLVLMLGLCGCSDSQMTQTKEPTEETTGITETAEVENTESLLSSESKQEDTAEVPENTDSSEIPAQTAEPEKTNPQTVRNDAPPAVTAPPEDKGDPAKETESEKAEETPPAETEKPQETQKPAETEPQPVPEAPEETKPKSAYDFEFDIEAIKADCIAIGNGMGLHLDTSLTPSNAAYWNPVAATQTNQGEALKRNLESYIKFHTVENLGSYGMDEITDFNIYYEARGNGEYLIYFLFAQTQIRAYPSVLKAGGFFMPKIKKGRLCL